MLSFDFKNNKVLRTYKKTISIFPVSTSVIRSLPFTIIEEIANKFTNDYKIRVIIDNSNYSECLKKKNFKKNFLFIKPKNVKELFSEVSKSNFGIFVDSGPLHIAKIYSKLGILIETSVQSKVLLTNSKNIYPVHNVYKSRYCNGPCGLVDVFAYDSVVGCYETNKISFDEIKTLNSFRNLQRWNKKDSNAHFISNPVGCVKQIDLKNIIDLIKVKIKESQ
jgi:ADP-heptose:LPS heptosyltransferase